jgi:hypothetical protein
MRIHLPFQHRDLLVRRGEYRGQRPHHRCAPRPSPAAAEPAAAIAAWTLLVIGSVASLAANVAVAEPTEPARVIAAWPSFALIDDYELLMRQVRHAAKAGTS